MTTSKSIATIKEFCKRASSYDVRSIHCEYDGSGDSGDMTCYVVRSLPQTAGAEAAPEPPVYSQEISTSLKDVLTAEDTLIDHKRLEEFLDAAYDLLPGGWEINDGSYGEISIDVATGAIHTQHSERIIEIETTERDY